MLKIRDQYFSQFLTYERLNLKKQRNLTAQFRQTLINPQIERMNSSLKVIYTPILKKKRGKVGFGGGINVPSCKQYTRRRPSLGGIHPG